MPLTEAQIVDLSKLIGENYPATRAALPVPTAGVGAADVAAIEAELISLITKFALVEDNHTIVGGGRDGIDVNKERDRQKLRVTARRLLGMPVAEFAPGAVSVVRFGGAPWF